MARIELDDDTLRSVQLVELELLIEVDRICRKTGIRYNIIAGTMLGAVRHGGFIPWDDDADVAMFRDEYERFREACRTELDTDKYYFQEIRDTSGYRWGYGKLRKKDTLFLREYQEDMPYEQGVFIDIFPLDAVPDPKPLRTLKNFECYCVRKFLWSKVGKKADRCKYKRAAFSLMDKVPEKAIFAYYHGMVRRAGRLGKTKMVRILLFPTPNSEYGYYRRWYEGYTDIKFEGVTMCGVVDPEDYLSFKFGRYMELPPESERKAHPVSAIAVPKRELLEAAHEEYLRYI